MHTNLSPTSAKNHEQGAALLASILVIVVIAGAVGVALNYTQSTNKLVDSSRDYSDLRFESEGALETAYGIWLNAANIKYGPPTPTEIDSSVRGPTPPAASSPFNFPYAAGGQLKVEMVDAYGVPLAANQKVEDAAVYVSLKDYPGWRGVKYSYTASVKLAKSTAAGAQTYGLKRNIEYVSAPLFQAMGFFQDDIEFYKPAPMIIAGLVHTNHRAYMSSGTATGLNFQNNTSNVDGYTETEFPIGATAWNNAGSNLPPVFSNGGKAAQVNKVETLYPLGTKPEEVLEDPKNPDNNPNNDSMRELIEPPVAGAIDDPAIADRRLFNKAGIVVQITGPASNPANINVTAKNGVALTAPQITSIKSAISAQSITDRRENKVVDVSTIDINAINPVLISAKNFGTNGVLYVHDTSSTGTKAVRLKNGGTLPPLGLTVVSENPIYIQGDYNTGSTSTTVNTVPSNNGGNPNNTDSPVVPNFVKAPSAVIGDAVTILSNSWNDANSAKDLASRPATSTTVNTAIVTGNIPSGWDPDNNPKTNNSYGYSGGFNNFPRFLENWTGDSFTYFGSMVQLFTSKIFTGEWDTGTIYVPPNRAWNYDTSFLSKPPPGSLDVVTRSRGSLVRY